MFEDLKEKLSSAPSLFKISENGLVYSGANAWASCKHLAWENENVEGNFEGRLNHINSKGVTRMTDIIKLYQFKKIDGKTVKVPDGFQRVIRKHKKNFHIIHKDIKEAIKLLGHIFDDSQKICLKEKIQLQPKTIWIENVLKEIVIEMLDEIE